MGIAIRVILAVYGALTGTAVVVDGVGLPDAPVWLPDLTHALTAAITLASAVVLVAYQVLPPLKADSGGALRFAHAVVGLLAKAGMNSKPKDGAQ